MFPVRFPAVSALTLFLCGTALAGPIPVNVQSSLTGPPGVVPFDPPPGAIIPDSTFDLTANEPVKIASFGPSDSWYRPSGHTHDTAVGVDRSQGFTYWLKVTDVASGQSADTKLAVTAFARWTERPDGTALPIDIGVDVGSPTRPDFVLGHNHYFVEVVPFIADPVSDEQLRTATTSNGALGGGADVYLRAVPDVPQVPEPGTIALAACGLPLVGMWLRKRK